MSTTQTQYQIGVTAPFRLDLTVSVLRRLSTNIVDLLTDDTEYLRVFGGTGQPVIARVKQVRADVLVVHFEGGNARDHARALAIVHRILGTDRDISQFDRAARGLPWLRDLVVRMRGVKPPRYPTLWEACVNAILFQQVSLAAASSISRRLILALGQRVASGQTALYSFPDAGRLRVADDGVLRAAGVSANKLATLRRVADALESGALDEATLEALPSPAAIAVLRGIKGIGPWTATIILLRGLGRLDVFPMNDSSVVQNLAFVAGSIHLEIDEVLAALGAQRGMLYYYLLLARLETRGDVGRASTVPAA
jgi:DNA-3-methyladenine glycosylase II